MLRAIIKSTPYTNRSCVPYLLKTGCRSGNARSRIDVGESIEGSLVDRKKACLTSRNG